MEKKTCGRDGKNNETTPLKSANITPSVQCRLITLPESSNAAKRVPQLLYTHSGDGVLALGSDGILTLWKWATEEQNPSGKATTQVVPQQWKPRRSRTMVNHTVEGLNPENVVPCLALSRNDGYVISACGGEISLFNMHKFKTCMTFMPPPPASTCLQLYPNDNNVLAVGLDNSKVAIYYVPEETIIYVLEGHKKGITGLAFSTYLNILVSAGGDGVLCLSSACVKIKTVQDYKHVDETITSETRVQFHPSDVTLLVVQGRLLATYDCSKMERVHEWVPHDDLSSPISYATYSCNGELVYASFKDGQIVVFDADTLKPRCCIDASAYESDGVAGVYPLVIATHPLYPNQIALGLSDGSVKVMEPSELEGEWYLPAKSP